MKAAPVLAALKKRGVQQTLIHTGQHYDESMSAIMFRQLALPEPDINLSVGSGSHATQTAAVMTALEPIIASQRPSMMILYGDVNSTLAAALVAAKANIEIAHVEAGVRSFDRSMPEEINRIVTDRLSSCLLAPSASAVANLIAEGISPDQVHDVGNVMVDTLKLCLPAADASQLLNELGVGADEPYLLVTLHRAGNVDDDIFLNEVMQALTRVANELCRVIFPVHPRTRSRLPKSRDPRLHLISPAGYFEFVDLQRRARVILTDSGGVQAEAAYLRVPCLTLRPNTEWTDTVTAGANTVIGRNPGGIFHSTAAALKSGGSKFKLPDNWDGMSAERIADVITAQTSVR
jgi:UDP-N-acetylglucosamine 2-epimerase (non-hydrolysing)